MFSLQGSLFDVQAVLDYGQSIVSVGQELSKILIERRTLNSRTIQAKMNKFFQGSDSEGAWQWKDAYEALEVACIFYLRETKLSENPLTELELIQSLCPTQTKRTEQQLQLQQFSTPLEMGYVVAKAGQIVSGDIVLEPSAGTGILAQFAKKFGASLILNELADNRNKILRRLFPGSPIFQVNAEQIDDFLTGQTKPSVVLMNPPFSASPNRQDRNPDATVKHVGSAFNRLADGGRLVAITANWFSPINHSWRDAFVKIQQKGKVLLSVGIEGKAYNKHGTNMVTRITVIDKVPSENPLDIACIPQILSLNDILSLIEQMPKRQTCQSQQVAKTSAPVKTQVRQTHLRLVTEVITPIKVIPDVLPLNYEVIAWKPTDGLRDSLYETYRPQRVRIQGAKPHPSLLCESAALSLVSPPAPNYIPHLPTKIVDSGLLSEAQLESVIYAGQAHAQLLSGYYLIDESYDNINVTDSNPEDAVQFRKGWFLGDGTGAGKGRQVAGIILDNWCQGRRKAIWISKSATLIEDARRDWCALGGDKDDIIDLSNIKLGNSIPDPQGILFVTYATLRSEKGGKSRLQQIIDWAGKDFEGVISFDECHAMGNAISEESLIGKKKASMQGINGIRLQNALPAARVVYVSATGATKVSNLAYANRLGLWQTGDLPFTSREDFIESIEDSGVAAMEIVARDLKALGLYLARSLSFEGVEYDTLEINLTSTQQYIYNSYAEAFQVIHENVERALEACNVISSGSTYNRASKMAAHSQFESHKQRFFNHLLTSMKCPLLIRAIERDIADGNAVVIQVVSTNEELLKRQLYNIPQEQWSDIDIDLTPREYVMDYLVSAFPIILHEIYSSEDGEPRSRVVYDAENKPVISQEALELRDALIDRLASLDPLPGALEQILWHFGHNQVAEVTGRSKRVLKDESGRLYVDNRTSGANIAETTAFMSDQKQILIFSDAGGTGRSYHADLNALNRRRRIHYLLEPGWRADNAIQGLGRSHRTNQASAPVFRPVTTDVCGERRFISTIARRLDSLGALTRGQRQTGGNGIFDTKDNLESIYAERALHTLFTQIYLGQFHAVPLTTFESATGLTLGTKEGGIKIDLPPLRQFLNRLLALRLEMQNLIFDRFEILLNQEIEIAVNAGIFEVGVETLRADHLNLLEQSEVSSHNGNSTRYLKIERVNNVNLKTAEQAISQAAMCSGHLMINQKSGKAAIVLPTSSIVGDDGGVVSRVKLIRPNNDELRFTVENLNSSTWKEVSEQEFKSTWTRELNDVPRTSSQTIHLITGILLPIWKVLPQKHSKVFRLQLSTGEKVLGRVILPEDMAKVSQELGIKNTLLSSQEIISLVLNKFYSETLPGGVTLRRSLVAGESRLELVNAQSFAERLIQIGCFTEIIQWRKRIFIPTGVKAPSVLDAVINILG